MQSLMSALLPIRLAPAPSPDLCRPDSDTPFFSPEQSRSAHDILPEKRPVDLTRLGSQLVRVVLYNPLGESTDQVFSTLVLSEKVCVFDSNRQPVESQISPVWGGHRPVHRLHWRAQLPGLSLQTFFLGSGDGNCQLAELATVQVFNQKPGKCRHLLLGFLAH